jgi:hypothetical protein
MKSNRWWYLFFSILSYCISTMASITFVWGLHINDLELIQLSATCVLFMAGAWFTLKEASAIREIKYIGEKQKISYKHRGYSRFCYISLYFICTVLSIFTTANMAFEAINRDSDFKTVNSDSYKLSKASIELSMSTVEQNNKAISSLLTEKEKAVSTQMAQVEKWKTTAVTQRQKEIDRANAIASEYDKKIERLRQANINIQPQLISPLPSSEVIVGSGKKTIVDMFPSINFVELALYAILLLSLGVDLLGAFFTIQYTKETYFNTSKIKPNFDTQLATLGVQQKEYKIKPKKEVVIAGFQASKKQEIDSETKEMFYQELKKSAESKKTKTADGYDKIATKLNIKREDARTIRKELEREGRITKQGNRTVIVN